MSIVCLIISLALLIVVESSFYFVCATFEATWLVYHLQEEMCLYLHPSNSAGEAAGSCVCCPKILYNFTLRNILKIFDI